MKNVVIGYLFRILILIWMIVLFLFSNDNAEVSDNKSSKIAEQVVEIITTNETPPAKKAELVKKINPIVRKIAHFSLYALGGLLIMSYIDLYNLNDFEKIILSFIAGGMYAGFDETHQMFIPGRTKLLTDVIIDSLGVLTGIVFYLICREIYKRIKNKKEKKLKN